jgi:hypothetical protein
VKKTALNIRCKVQKPLNTGMSKPFGGVRARSRIDVRSVKQAHNLAGIADAILAHKQQNKRAELKAQTHAFLVGAVAQAQLLSLLESPHRPTVPETTAFAARRRTGEATREASCSVRVEFVSSSSLFLLICQLQFRVLVSLPRFP